MAEPLYLVAGVAIAVAITVSLRAAGFFARGAVQSPALMTVLERWMPLGVVAILAVYCVLNIDFGTVSAAVPQVVGAIVTVGLHLWKRNMLLSILGGALACIVLANWAVPAVMA